jgi:hypothetical protein
MGVLDQTAPSIFRAPPKQLRCQTFATQTRAPPPKGGGGQPERPFRQSGGTRNIDGAVLINPARRVACVPRFAWSSVALNWVALREPLKSKVNRVLAQSLHRKATTFGWAFG